MQTRLCITKVNEGTMAKQVGCQEGDFIVQINDVRHVNHFDDVRAAVRSRNGQITDLICYSVEKDSCYGFSINPVSAGISFKAAPVSPDVEEKIMGRYEALEQGTDELASEVQAQSEDNGIVFVDEDADGQAQETESVASGELQSGPQQNEGLAHANQEHDATGQDENESEESAEQSVGNDPVDALLNNAESKSIDDLPSGSSEHDEAEQANPNNSAEGDEWPDATVDIDALVGESLAESDLPIDDISNQTDLPNQVSSGEDVGATEDTVSAFESPTQDDDSEVIVVGEHDDPELAREVKGFLDKTKPDVIAALQPDADKEAGVGFATGAIDQMHDQLAGRSLAPENEPEASVQQDVDLTEAQSSPSVVPVPSQNNMSSQQIAFSGEPLVVASCFSQGKIPIVFGPTFNGIGFSRMSYLGAVQVMVRGTPSESLLSSAYAQMEHAALAKNASGIVDCRQNIESIGINAQGEPVVLINLYGTAIRCMN